MQMAMRNRGAVIVCTAAFVGFFTVGRFVQADDGASKPTVVADEPSPEASKLTVHGFLSQAYGRADGETAFGIPNTGTTDYRTAALQFGYGLTDKDRLVIQLGHQRIGVADEGAFLPDVSLELPAAPKARFAIASLSVSF
jgi:hypothetical protein